LLAAGVAAAASLVVASVASAATPLAPTGVKAAAASDGAIAVSWNKVTGATSYSVYDAATSGGESTAGTAACSTTAATTCTVTGLSDGTTYYFEVVVTNVTGPSLASIEASATAMTPPTGLTATLTNGVVSLSWSAYSNATSYSVYDAATSGGESTAGTAACSTTTATTCTVTGLSDGTTYYFAVVATTSSGSSPASSEVTATMTPASPANLLISAGGRIVTLSWTSAFGATGYSVYDAITSGGESTTGMAACTTTTATSCTATGFSDGTTYYFEVVATNNSGSSPASFEVSVTPTQLTAPYAPQDVWATANDTAVSLSWTSASGATGYSVYDATTSGGESATGTPVCTTTVSTTCTIYGLTDGTTYYFELAATNSAGSSPVSTEVSATPVSPFATGNLSAYNAALAAVVQGDYTTGSWTTYQVVVSANPASTSDLQSVIVAATAAISTAQGSLVTVTGNRSAYNAALAAVVEGDYTTGSWTTYQGVVSANPASTFDLQSGIDAATAAITAAQGSLVAVAGGGSPAPSTGPTNAPPPSSLSASVYGTPNSGTASSTTATTLRQSSGGATGTVTVPAGALPAGTTVSVYPITNTSTFTADVPAGQSYVLSFAVSWETPSNTSPTANTPITMTITDPSIKAGDTIYELTSTGLVAVGTATVEGLATVTFSSDPVFVVAEATLASQAALTLTTLQGTVGKPLALATSGGSGTGEVTFTVTNGSATGCVVSGSSLNSTTAGTCVVTATKTADSTYLVVSALASTVSLSLPARPAAITVAYHAKSYALSAGAKNALLTLSKKLLSGASVTITGYANANKSLAGHRAEEAANYLAARVSIHIKVVFVTHTTTTKTTVVTTKQ
jgi:hypothetical protein